MPWKAASPLAPLLAAGLLFGWSPASTGTRVEAQSPSPAAPHIVLVLYSNTRLLPANVEFEQGLRKSFESRESVAIERFDEFLDVPRFAAPDHLRNFAFYLRDKYASHPPEVIVAMGEEGLNFLLGNRRELFADIPVVHAAVPRGALRSFEPLPSEVVGIPMDIDFAGTVAQALRWHPLASKLSIITGSSPWDKRWEGELRQDAQQFTDRLRIEFLAGLATPALLRQVAAIGKDAIVFTPGYFQDGDGRTFIPRDTIEKIATASPAPVYAAFSTAVGTGAVGGRVVTFQEMGREAGNEAVRLLVGEKPADLLLPPSLPSVMRVDWRQVRRWGIDRLAIPSGTITQFREPTQFEAHPFQMLLVVSVVALQAGLISLLLIERRRLRAANIVEQGLRLELAHASRLAVAGELMGSIAHEINQPLGAILANADTADLLLATGHDHREELAAILADIRRDDLRASEAIRKLRSFLARHEVERRPFEIHEALREVESLLQAEARRRRVELEVQPSALAGRVLGDRIQIQQVLLNLTLNAMDAVAEVPDDRRTIVLSVRTGQTVVEIRASDRGHGVPAHLLPKLFDSFYTTKRQGMGLGLSIARTLVEAHGGRIWVESWPGEKTTFYVALPVVGATETSVTEIR